MKCWAVDMVDLLFPGFWSRNLVDAKVAEVKRYMREQDLDVSVAMERVLGVKVGKY